MTRRGHNAVVAVGETIADHIFSAESGELVFQGTRGGGSSFNLLVNSSSAGAGEAIALGAAGNDWRGHVALADLLATGVTTDGIRVVPNRLTRAIFQRPRRLAARLLPSPATGYTTSGKCVICGAGTPATKIASVERVSNDLTLPETAGVLCVDRLSRRRRNLVHLARSSEVPTVLDLGRRAYLRFASATETAASLREFDIVLMPMEIATSLTRRAGFSRLSDLCKVGPTLALFVSAGASGMLVLDCRTHPVEYDLPAPAVEGQDATGAGDAFLGYLVTSLLSEVSPQPWQDTPPSRLRAMTEMAVAATKDVVGTLGARGHISVSQKALDSPLSGLEGMSATEIRSQISRQAICPFCGSDMAERRVQATLGHRRPGARANVAWLARRMLAATEKRDAIAQCRSLLQTTGACYVLGTGGSLSVAAFISAALSRHGHVFSQPMRPLDFIRLGKPADLVIAVSYSGRSRDIGDAILEAKAIGTRQVVLVTGHRAPALTRLLSEQDGDLIVTYGRPERNGNSQAPERGFVSIAGTVAPCALWAAAIAGPQAMTEFVRSLTAIPQPESQVARAADAIAQWIRTSPVLEAFGGGWAWPALIDLESKFTEGNIAPVRIHEPKDFSHGRFISLFSGGREARQPIPFLGVGGWNTYERALADSLSRHASVFPITSEYSDILGALELMVAVQVLVQRTGESLGIDVSRPRHVSRDGVALYHWKEGLSDRSHGIADQLGPRWDAR